MKISQRTSVVLADVVLASFWLLFVYVNIIGWNATGKYTLLLGAIEASVTAMLFLIRRPATVASERSVDWGVAFAATFMPQLLRPALSSFSGVGSLIMLVGLVISIGSLLSLWRSFGIVPAWRGLKTDGLYEYVRHPMYLGGLVAVLGYVIGNFSAMNAGILLVTVVLVLVRIGKEEAFLMRGEEYHHYRKTVRYRLIPFIY